MVKNLPTNAGDIRDMALSPGLGRSPGSAFPVERKGLPVFTVWHRHRAGSGPSASLQAGRARRAEGLTDAPTGPSAPGHGHVKALGKIILCSCGYLEILLPCGSFKARLPSFAHVVLAFLTSAMTPWGMVFGCVRCTSRPGHRALARSYLLRDWFPCAGAVLSLEYSSLSVLSA